MKSNNLTKSAAKTVSGALTNFLRSDANSTSCVFVHQPKAPKSLERFKKN